MGVVLDLLLRLSAILALLAHRLGVAPRTHASHVPALNIEHHIERESQFVIIVLGEALLNLTYSAVPPNVGVTPQFGRSILGLMATYLFGWLYFEQDVSHTFVHALRRHWFSAFASVYVHFPLSAGLILWSASLHQLVDHETVSKGVQWYLAGGLSVSLLCLAVIGWLHKSMDAKGSSLIPRNVLIVLRVAAAITCVLLPLSDNLNDSVHILSIHVSILIALVVLDAVGKFGAMPDSSLSTRHDVASSSQGNNTAEEQGQAGDQNQGQLDRILSSETVNATTEKQPEVVEKLESAVVV
ncbi:hypothetical protein AX16_000284 [Volvariella volvacea WC 439]|nr:hypothetical protein AX16_000284 [Volvariella volvacea WC 439]